MNNIYLDHLLSKIKIKQSELETLNSTLSYYSTELDRKYYEILKKNNIDISHAFKKSEKFNYCSTSDDIDKDDDKNVCTNDVIISEHKLILDSLYKQLIMKTHPDKLVDSTNNDFINVKDAYEKQNVLQLIDYANKYKLLNSNLEDFDINIIVVILEKKILEIKKDIKKIKSTIGFNLLVNNIDDHIDSLKYTIKLANENEKHKKEHEKLVKETEELRKKILLSKEEIDQ